MTLQAIKDIVDQAVGQIKSEFKFMKEEVNQSLEPLETHFDAQLALISQKIDSIEVVQGELNRKMETIKSQVVETAAKVNTLERDYNNLQEEHAQLKEDNRKLHNILENVDNRAR